MSGFRFPLHSEPTPPLPADPSTPLEDTLKNWKGDTMANAGVLTEQVIDENMPSADKENKTNLTPMKFGATAKPESEPATPQVFQKPIRVVQTARPQDDFPTLADLVNWKNPPASFCALIAGESMFVAGYYLFSLGNASFLSGACSLMLFALAMNFIRSLFSETWLRGALWSGSNFETMLLERTKDTITFAMVVRDQTVCSNDPWTMLRSGITLSLVGFIARFVSFWSLGAIGWAAAFVVTPHQQRVFGWCHKGYSLCKEGMNRLVRRLHLDRSSKLLALAAAAVPVMIQLGFSGWLTVTLLFLMYGRCTLNRDEVKAFQSHRITQAVRDNSVIHSAYKASVRVSNFADDVLQSAMKSARHTVDKYRHNHLE